MLIIAVDPGKSGAIATWEHGSLIYVDHMPLTETDLWDYFRCLSMFDGQRRTAITCICERITGHRAGNAASTSVTLAMNAGACRMACIGNEIPLNPPEGVMPAVWMEKVVPGRPKGRKLAKGEKRTTREEYELKKARKQYIRDAMQKLYPHLKVTLVNADALGILTYELRRRGLA